MKITLKTLPTATKQQVFDQIAKHLILQGMRSTDKSGHTCMYLGHDRLKCAAGCLISDQEYNKEWEGKSWGGLCDTVPSFPNNHKSMIADLQYIHDSDHPRSWKHSLKAIAKDNKLEFKFDNLNKTKRK